MGRRRGGGPQSRSQFGYRALELRKRRCRRDTACSGIGRRSCTGLPSFVGREDLAPATSGMFVIPFASLVLGCRVCRMRTPL
eukprot:4131930-Alexandrium_andersonii.AAC.1